MVDGIYSDDPGWGRPHEILLGALLPGVMARRAAKAATPLVALRGVFLSFVMALVLIGIVVLVLASAQGDTEPDGVASDPTLTLSAAVAATAALSVVLLTLAATVPKRLTCVDLGQLVAQYRTKFFLRVAFSEACALLGFVAFFLCEHPMPYFIGMAFAYVGFAQLAPTRAHLEREQEVLRDQGCPHDLYAALLGRGG